MDKKIIIIEGVEISDVHVELDFCGMEGAPVTPCVWFKVNGFETMEWLKKADDGMYWVERRDTWESTNEHEELVATTGLGEDVYDEFLDELHDYLDEIVFIQTQGAMSENPECYELRYCEYGRMPHVGCTGSTLDGCVSCAQEIEELEFFMREQAPLNRERYYIAQCVTHEVLKRF